MGRSIWRAAWLAGSAASLLLAGQAAAQPPPREPTPRESIALGRQLVARNCGMCHAAGVTGVSPNPQAPPFYRLDERLDVDTLGEGLATGILTRHPAMPEFRFAPNEVVAIVRYLRSVQAKQRVSMPVALAAR